MKQLLLGFFLAGALALTGCGSSPASSALSQSAPAASSPASSAAPESQAAESAGQDASSDAQTPPKENEPDVDLTQMGANMVYAVVYQMTLDPATYEGQTVKVAGEYYSAPGPQKTYYFLYVSDAAAC